MQSGKKRLLLTEKISENLKLDCQLLRVTRQSDMKTVLQHLASILSSNDTQDVQWWATGLPLTSLPSPVSFLGVDSFLIATIVSTEKNMGVSQEDKKLGRAAIRKCLTGCNVVLSPPPPIIVVHQAIIDFNKVDKLDKKRAIIARKYEALATKKDFYFITFKITATQLDFHLLLQFFHTISEEKNEDLVAERGLILRQITQKYKIIPQPRLRRLPLNR
jgi:hypothetical protein